MQQMHVQCICSIHKQKTGVAQQVMYNNTLLSTLYHRQYICVACAYTYQSRIKCTHQANT